jgi:hypothetical protein
LPPTTSLIVFFGAAVAMTADLIAHDPALLERRMKGGPTAEKEPFIPRLSDHDL